METCDLCGKEYEDLRESKRGKPRRYCSEKCKSRAQDLREKYGLDAVVYRQMIADQGGVCAICLKALDEPHVDHDHLTGRIRGLLCSLCNAGLGAFRDNLEWLE